MTKKRRITISLSDEAYDRMIDIINQFNDRHKHNTYCVHLSKSDYIDELILTDYIDNWI